MIPDANLGWLFPEVPFADRFAAAAEAGFTAVEMPWPPLTADEVTPRLTEHALTPVLVNIPVGEADGPFRFGCACDPGQRDAFRRTFTDALAYADRTGTRFIHVIGGLIPDGVEQAEAYATYRENLGWALDQLPTSTGPTLVVEAINRRDNPRFVFAGLDEVAQLIRSVGHPRVRLLFDTFHCGVEGDPTAVGQRFAEVWDVVGHVQVGDAPDRTDPGTGTVDFDDFFTVLRDLDYTGFVGGEYRPTAGTHAGLGWRDRL